MSNDLEVMKAMASLYRKKAAVMKALDGGMVKGGENKHFGYKYVTASAIKKEVGQLLADHGLSLQMSGVATENAVSEVEQKNGSIKRVPILRIQFAISLCDVDTGAKEESFWFGEAGATDDKAASKCATSALKYYLLSNLLIADRDEDKHDTDRDASKRNRPAPNTTAPQTMKPGEAIKSVLPEYEPFMAPEKFETMKEYLREGLHQNKIQPTTPQEARNVIDKGYAKWMDWDALTAARKERG